MLANGRTAILEEFDFTDDDLSPSPWDSQTCDFVELLSSPLISSHRFLQVTSQTSD